MKSLFPERPRPDRPHRSLRPQNSIGRGRYDAGFAPNLAGSHYRAPRGGGVGVILEYELPLNPRRMDGVVLGAGHLCEPAGGPVRTQKKPPFARRPLPFWMVRCQSAMILMSAALCASS
jgi:hypothetical protein